MKKGILFILTASLCSCFGNKQIQADIMNAELVKIDTVYRYPNVLQQVLIWQCKTGIQYINYAPAGTIYPIGSTMKVLIRK